MDRDKEQKKAFEKYRANGCVGSIIAGTGSKRPFSVRNLGALKDRKDNTGKTVRKLLEEKAFIMKENI